MKVLVVDDDVVSRMVLMHLVDSVGGIEVVEAEDGLDAWDQLSAGLNPDLCFCDLRMPRLSGMDLLERVKAAPALQSIGFVMVSSANETEVVGQAMQLGAAGYIIKPFEPEQVRRHLSQAADAESPHATMERLGINAERLLAYLGGLQAQIIGAGADLPGLLAQGGDALKLRIERLHTGCQTLGLHAAAAQLALLTNAHAEAIAATLDASAQRVGAQLEHARRLVAAA